MTSFVDNTYTYEGKDALEWYTKAMNGAPSLDLMRIHPGVKNSINVPNIDTSRSLKAGSCTFAATGDITVGTNKISVVDVDINKEICESDIEAIFLSEQMRPGSNNEEFLPEMVRDMIVELEMKSTKKELEEMIWQGDTAGGAGNHLDIMDGLVKKFLADGTVVDVATPVTLTTANIETEIGKVVAAIPEAMLNEQNNPKVGIGISLKARTLYRASLAQNSPVMYRNTPVDEQLTFDGWKLFPLDGMPTNTMCFGNFDKIWFGTDLSEDIGDITIIPMKKTTGDKKVRISGSLKAGVGYAYGAEVVLYGTGT